MGIFKRKSRIDNNTMKNGAKLITVAKPKSVAAEQFRTVRTNIHFMAVDRRLKTIAFTSANISEGKSTVAANLAIVWAQEGKSVLLIDADMRRPTLYSTFDLAGQEGLSTVLSSDQSEVNLNDVIQESGIEGLDLLPSGAVPPNPAELLSSQRMKVLLEAVQAQYDLVVLDVPPMLKVTDTQTIAGSVDGVVLVVRQGMTQKAGVRRVVELLQMSHAHLLGYVMNDVIPEDDAGYGYGYGYGYEKESKD